MPPVATTAELIAALAAASPGDVITMQPGTYVVSSNLSCSRAGASTMPITVRAETLGSVIIESSAVEGFHVTAPYWTFENLEMRGTCADDSSCEHAFHITGNADGVVLRNNRLRDFNAQVKGNGAPVGAGGAYVWPDDVLIEGNELWDTRARNTSNPVTKLDIVGGRRWRVHANYIHDFAKGGGDTVSYAAFLKGNSRDGVMDRNLVVCSRLHTGGTRLGLSLGGGGTSPDSICEDGTCSPEHQNGMLRNNIIAHCSDVGIYLNEAAASSLYHNTLHATAGIDVRYLASTASVRGNLSTGALRDREGGTHTEADNALDVGNAAFEDWFVDPDNLDFQLDDGSMVTDRAAVLLPDVPDDFCGNTRSGAMFDRGAIEYQTIVPCDTTRTYPDGPLAADAGIDGPWVTDGDEGGGCCNAGGRRGARGGLAAFALSAFTMVMIARRRRRA
jgi:parallel beta-helix repeat protein